MSRAISDKLNAAFGDPKKFHELVDSNWPAIDEALRGYEYACRVVDFGYQFGTFDFSVLRKQAADFVRAAPPSARGAGQ